MAGPSSTGLSRTGLSRTGLTGVGTVSAFDAHVGLGSIVADDGAVIEFQCIGIADGTRQIAVDSAVSFELIPKLGRYEATAITPR